MGNGQPEGFLTEQNSCAILVLRCGGMSFSLMLGVLAFQNSRQIG
jgi:hypothetical protein